LWGRRQQIEVPRLLDCGEAIQRAYSCDYAQGREKSVCSRHWNVNNIHHILISLTTASMAEAVFS
jgi:hypothetical protein